MPSPIKNTEPTSWEVLTGCPPFSDIIRDETVIYNVMEWVRPDRPPSGFSDTLRQFLMSTWAA